MGTWSFWVPGMVIWGDDSVESRSRRNRVDKNVEKMRLFLGLGVDESYRGNVCVISIRIGMEFAKRAGC